MNDLDLEASMRQRARLQPSLYVVAMVFMTALWSAATAWGQGAGPFDTYTVTPCRVLDTRISVPAGPVAANGAAPKVGGPWSTSPRP